MGIKEDLIPWIENIRHLFLTYTDRMDETEVLCTNIGIMVNGELKCLGSLQHLKSKYGEGYTILAKIKLIDYDKDQSDEENAQRIDKFVSFILNHFQSNGCSLKESRDGFINLHISDNSNLLLSKLFSTMEKYKEEFFIEHYTVTQANLEQIFLSFSNKQISSESRNLKKPKFFGFFKLGRKETKTKNIK